MIGSSSKSEKSVEDVLSSIRKIIAEDLQGHQPSSYGDLKDNFQETQRPSFEGESYDYGYRRLDTSGSQEDVLELTTVVLEDGRLEKISQKEESQVRRGAEIYQFHQTQEAPMSQEKASLSQEEMDQILSQSEPLDLVSPSSVAQETEDLVSESVMSQSAAALSQLMSVAQERNRREDVTLTAQNAGGQTLEELMIKLLRPMLKEWLDANLLSVVKLSVAEQIEKMLKQKI
jgi:cell pole-organizing protein PopZ